MPEARPTRLGLRPISPDTSEKKTSGTQGKLKVERLSIISPTTSQQEIQENEKTKVYMRKNLEKRDEKRKNVTEFDQTSLLINLSLQKTF